MDLRLRVIIGLGAIVILLGILNMLRKEKLDLKYVLSWILVDLTIMILAIWPSIIDVVANIMGVDKPINAVFFMGMVFLLIIIYSLTVAQSRSSNKLKNLAQTIALYEHESKR